MKNLQDAGSIPASSTNLRILYMEKDPNQPELDGFPEIPDEIRLSLADPK